MGSFSEVAGWGLVAGAAVVGGLVAEALWTVRRPLPSLTGLDASGTIPGATAAERQALVVVAMGDSTLTGPGLTDPGQIWLRRALERLARPQPIVFHSLAEGGSRVADVARRIDAALAIRPNIVVVAVGSNDALHGTPTRSIRKLLDAVLGQLLDEVAVVAIANVGDLGSIPRVPPPLRSILQARSRAVRSVIEDVVESHDRAILLDVTPADETLRAREAFLADLFHPGEVGHQAWADAALPGLRAAFERLSAGDAAVDLR
jgi:lysophospholipase L1-like esterase